MRIILLSFLFFLSLTSQAYQMNSNFGHLYWALGPGLSTQGNLRLGFKDYEFGILQNKGIGLMVLQRTQTPLFLQTGLMFSNGGGLFLGGGMEWDNYSWFRLRTDITVGTTPNFETEAVVCFGGVFVL